MTVVTAPSHDTLAHMARHIRLLTAPYTIAIHQRARAGRTTWTAIIHPPLLDQLREASTPGGSSVLETIRKRHRGSISPIAGDAIDTLARIEVAITLWHTRLRMCSPDRALDWFKAALRQLDAAAPHIAPSIAGDLARAVEGWWTDAARASGWYPNDLRNAR